MEKEHCKIIETIKKKEPSFYNIVKASKKQSVNKIFCQKQITTTRITNNHIFV